MDWAGKTHPIEAIADWIAPLALALAAGWACQVMDYPLAASAAGAAGLFVAGAGLMRIAGKGRGAEPFQFEPATLEPQGDAGELLLEASDELLELTDPLLDVGSDSRVVRLFEREQPTPGELVDRISGFLEGTAPRTAMSASPPDASAALHAALANIRASLR